MTSTSRPVAGRQVQGGEDPRPEHRRTQHPHRSGPIAGAPDPEAAYGAAARGQRRPLPLGLGVDRSVDVTACYLQPQRSGPPQPPAATPSNGSPTATSPMLPVDAVHEIVHVTDTEPGHAAGRPDIPVRSRYA